MIRITLFPVALRHGLRLRPPPTPARLNAATQQALDASTRANTNVSVLNAGVTSTLERELHNALTPIAGLAATVLLGWLFLAAGVVGLIVVVLVVLWLFGGEEETNARLRAVAIPGDAMSMTAKATAKAAKAARMPSVRWRKSTKWRWQSVRW